MQLVSYFNRPEYIFRPRQIYQRFFDWQLSEEKSYQTIKLPWQVDLIAYLEPNDSVGKAIASYGIYDLSLTEALWRLAFPGEVAVDIGANVGYTTSIMAKRVGSQGKVICFEPNPFTFKDLDKNITHWQQRSNWHHIKAHELALSKVAGIGKLILPNKNRGEAFIQTSKTDELQQNNHHQHQEYTVNLVRLDEIIQDIESIGVMKIDVEGHELEVLQGAETLIAKGCIRDLIFEEHKGYPSPVSQYLEKQGYTIFRIWKGFWRPRLKNPNPKIIHPWEPPNYLATLNPQRALQLFQKYGWYSLHNSEIK